MKKDINLLTVSDKEITDMINNTGFNLYGNYKKEEKKKIIHLFDEYPNEVDFVGVHTNEWGDRVLTIIFWNLPPLNEDEDEYYKYTYSY